MLEKQRDFSYDRIFQALDTEEVPLRIVVSLIVLWGLLFSAGCQTNFVDVEAPPQILPSPVAEPTNTFAPVSPPQGDAQMTSSVSTSFTPGMQNLIEKAKEDLAQRLSISSHQINLVEATEVVWPNSSLGCPQPSMMYTQVLTPGYLIRFQALTSEFEYHTNKDNLVIYCENPSPPLPGAFADR
jgi:hypothetical protein